MSTLRRAFKASALMTTLVAIAMTPAAAQRAQQDGRAPIGTTAVTLPNASRVTAKQMERLTARLDTAARIVERLTPEAQHRGLGAGWRQSSLQKLAPLSLDALARIEQRVFDLDAFNIAIADAATGSAATTIGDPQALGSPTSDLVYTPIAPCRFIDTRNVGGKINGFREFGLHLSGAAYGGSGACELPALFGVSPDGFGALALNITIVDTSTASTPGFLAVKPTAAAPATSLLNWYVAGPQVQLANQGIVTVNQDAGSPIEFVIQTAGAVHVVADVFGAFIAPAATPLFVTRVFASAEITDSQRLSLNSPACPPNNALVSGSCVGANELLLWTAGKVGNAWQCRYWNTSGATQTISSIATCARVP
jgi:hypothetical protein